MTVTYSIPALNRINIQMAECLLCPKSIRPGIDAILVPFPSDFADKYICNDCFAEHFDSVIRQILEFQEEEE